MEHITTLPEADRRDLFTETARQMGVRPAITEKDFWVCWALKCLFEDPELSVQMIFKGGTSLSKAFQVIERFSEDIDLILDWRIVTGKDPLERLSKTQQNKLNKQINNDAQGYIACDLLPKLSALYDPVASCALDEHDPHTVLITYPRAFDDDYIVPKIRLEIGPLAAWLPNSQRIITPYVADYFPEQVGETNALVNTIDAERTFWEKITILHQEAHRPAEKTLPSRYSRHYYDVFKMLTSDIVNRAQTNLHLLAAVVKFKQQFYPCTWVRYSLAKPGTLRLLPEQSALSSLEQDDMAMGNMIFGEYPTFSEIMEALKQFEAKINQT